MYLYEGNILFLAGKLYPGPPDKSKIGITGMMVYIWQDISLITLTFKLVADMIYT